MKKLLLVLATACLSLSASAELKTYNLTEGQTVNSVIPYADMPTLDSLKVTGTMQQSDLWFLNGLCRQFGVLEYVDLSEVTGFTEIPSKAFADVMTIKTVKLPSTITKVGDNAFSNMPKLENLTMPDDVQEIGTQAFLQDSLLARVVLPSKLEYVGDAAFMGCKAIGPKLEIPASVTRIGLGAFTYLQGVKELTVAEGNKEYKALNNVLYTADGKALLSCAGGFKGALDVADGTEQIQANAFAGAEGVTEVSLPASVKEIGDYAFDFMFGLELVNVDAGNAVYASKDGVLFDKQMQTLLIYPQGAKATTYATPSTVTGIATAAFANNQHLVDVTLNEGLKTIADYGFNDSPALQTIALPSTLESIGTSAFTYCTALQDVTIPSGVAYVPDYAFGECAALSDVTLQSGVQEIGVAAFIGCTALEGITLPSTLKLIYNGAFQRTGLKEINVPEGVTALDVNTFSYSQNLKSITLPSTLTSIGGSSFDGTAPEKVVCNATVPPMADYAFMFADLSASELVVPKGTEDAYKAAEGWKNFFKVSTGIQSVTTPSAEEKSTAIYGIDGTRLSKMRRGLNIVGKGKKVKK